MVFRRIREFCWGEGRGLPYWEKGEWPGPRPSTGQKPALLGEGRNPSGACFVGIEYVKSVALLGEGAVESESLDDAADGFKAGGGLGFREVLADGLDPEAGERFVTRGRGRTLGGVVALDGGADLVEGSGVPQYGGAHGEVGGMGPAVAGESAGVEGAQEMANFLFRSKVHD